MMRVPISFYPRPGAKVYSLVASLPFTPVDLDLGRMARGEWNPLVDRFRFWFIPGIDGKNDKTLCSVTVRKFDADSETLVFMHIVPNFGATIGREIRQPEFDVGILCNDDIRARSVLGATLDNPPAFHRRRELRLIERRWRDDPSAVMRFFANVQSLASLDPGAAPESVKVDEPSTAEALAILKEGMEGWWKDLR